MEIIQGNRYIESNHGKTCEVMRIANGTVHYVYSPGYEQHSCPVGDFITRFRLL